LRCKGTNNKIKQCDNSLIAETGLAMAYEPNAQTLIVGYARTLRDHLQSNGVDPRAVFAVDDLAEIEKDDSFARFPVERWDAAMSGAESLLGEPDLPLRLAEQIKPWGMGLLGFMMLTCRVLGEVGAVIARYENPVNGIARVWFEETTSQYVMRLKPDVLAGSRRLALLALGSWAWQARWLTGRDDLVFDASFDSPVESNLSAYRRSFGGDLRFDAAACWIRGDKDYLRLPVLQADAAIHQILCQQASERLRRPMDTHRTLVVELERLLSTCLDQGCPSLKSVAEQMGLSQRTLQNRLRDVGVSFRTLVDKVRQSRAEIYLRDDRTLVDIADQLGFTTQASFQHAFKRWTGRTPGEFRRGAGRLRDAGCPEI
jgi:AraC-like DNA-binding protein